MGASKVAPTLEQHCDTEPGLSAVLVLLVFVFLVMLATGVVFAAIVGKIVAYRPASGTAKTRADGGASRASQSVTDDRSAGRSETATNGGFGFAASWRTDRTPCSATDSGANGGPRGSSQLLAHDITQRAANTASDSGGSVTGSHCSLCKQKAQN